MRFTADELTTERAASRATNYWASHFGRAPDELFAHPLAVISHGVELADYYGVFALFRGNSAIASIPSARGNELGPLLRGLQSGCSPASLASALHDVAAGVIGPAFIGYATTICRSAYPARTLGQEDVPALRALQQSCSATEWEHGGCIIEHPCCGVFVDDELVAVAAYAIWGGAIAHISVIAHPKFRSRGFGRSAVGAIVRRALSAGLLPQYRTLESNRASVRIAESLGFVPYAISMAIRLVPTV